MEVRETRPPTPRSIPDYRKMDSTTLADREPCAVNLWAFQHVSNRGESMNRVLSKRKQDMHNRIMQAFDDSQFIYFYHPKPYSVIHEGEGQSTPLQSSSQVKEEWLDCWNVLRRPTRVPANFYGRSRWTRDYADDFSNISHDKLVALLCAHVGPVRYEPWMNE